MEKGVEIVEKKSSKKGKGVRKKGGERVEKFWASSGKVWNKGGKVEIGGTRVEQCWEKCGKAWNGAEIRCNKICTKHRKSVECGGIKWKSRGRRVEQG